MTDSLKFQIGCFGKLPAFSDFVRFNASGYEFNAFDRWLQEGIFAAKNQLGNRWDGVYEQAPLLGFIYYSEHSQTALAGMLRRSYDKSGRQYPFWIAVQLNKAQLTSQENLIPVLLERFFEETQKILLNSPSITMMEYIAGEIENLAAVSSNMNSREAMRNYLSTTFLEQFLRSIFKEIETERKYSIFYNLAEILLPMRGKKISRLALGLRFPLGKNYFQARYHICFWQQVVGQLLAASEQLLPVLFWSAPENHLAARLHWYARLPSPKDFANIINEDLTSDSICNLAEEGNSETARQRLPGHYRALLENGQLTLGDFLQNLG